MVKLSTLITLFFTILFCGQLISPQLVYAQETQNENYEGKVTAIVEEGQKTYFEELVEYQILEIKITSGSKKNQTIQVETSPNQASLLTQEQATYKVGDHVKIHAQQDVDGNQQYSIDGIVKRTGLIALTILFIVIVILVGRVWGALSIVGLVVSFLVIFKVIIPLIIKGINPVLAAILGSIVIIPTTFYISHGFNKKTHVGVATTFIGLLITGILAVYFTDMTHLTGFASEEAGFLQVERQGSIDIKGLLLAGIIIGTLGILDDVTIGQASTIEQLKLANPKMDWMELFKKGMNVGQDHISSMVNTLVLVYSGSALPLLLLFFDSQKTFIDILEFELIAEEIVRMLVGSIGLVLAAPLATVMAAMLFQNNNKSS